MSDFTYELEEFTGTPLFIVLTTHINETRKNRVIIRNKAALEVAERYGLPVIDLYSVALENAHFLDEGGIHFSAEGYKQLAKKNVERITETVPELNIL
ncbi:MAG: hypothetical protein E7418_00700 [Ruminococcaceae bacterium]|nr:hypothetical protein [Oscillospiraceae bacterium]